MRSITNVVKEVVEKTVVSPWKYLSILLIISLVFSLSELGEECSYTGDCKFGYCEDGVCRYPDVIEKYSISSSCNYTAQCLEGFCMDGSCVLPEREEYRVLSLGFKSGCAGIINNCVGIWCLFCNVTWVLLIVGGAVAAYVGRKRGRVLPAMLFIIPITFGVIFLPLLGVIMALVEILLLSIIKKV